MVRIMIKGGVWKNTEDEILKVRLRPTDLEPCISPTASAHFEPPLPQLSMLLL